MPLIGDPNSFIRCFPDNLRAEGELEIEPDVVINNFVTILCKKGIHIGEGTQIASGAQIVDHDHDMDPPMTNILKAGKVQAVWIGRYCWIGANAVILKGVWLEDGCVVGAGTIVLPGKYPKGSVIVGNPGKVKKTRMI